VESIFTALIEDCTAALETASPQSTVERILLEATKNPAMADAVAQRTNFSSLNDLIVYRNERLTLLAGSLPPGFSAAPHNHNLWSVVGVCGGQEDNQFFERDNGGLRQCGEKSVPAPGVLANAADVIHAISNPLEEPLLALHAYGGDLLGTARSNWDPETHEEISYDWEKVSSE
jgi:predicted metal-dependent enzyme (double-stranded beta helix superfamily)